MTEVFVHGVPDMARVFYAAPQEGSEALSFVTWKEPNERAYTISVPPGVEDQRWDPAPHTRGCALSGRQAERAPRVMGSRGLPPLVPRA